MEQHERDHRYFHVFKIGKLTVIGFEGKHLAHNEFASECRERLLDLVVSHECQVLVADLMDVGIVSSWILGVLAAVKRRGVEVHLYHPSPDVRDVLNTTHFDELLTVRSGIADKESRT